MGVELRWLRYLKGNSWVLNGRVGFEVCKTVDFVKLRKE